MQSRAVGSLGMVFSVGFGWLMSCDVPWHCGGAHGMLPECPPVVVGRRLSRLSWLRGIASPSFKWRAYRTLLSHLRFIYTELMVYCLHYPAVYSCTFAVYPEPIQLRMVISSTRAPREVHSL